ncbi:hypothetical protein LINGRAHAP2_LOCUS10571 [Linum grandiflorum]
MSAENIGSSMIFSAVMISYSWLSEEAEFEDGVIGDDDEAEVKEKEGGLVLLAAAATNTRFGFCGRKI